MIHDKEIQIIESSCFGKLIFIFHELMLQENREIKFWDKFAKVRLDYIQSLESLQNIRLSAGMCIHRNKAKDCQICENEIDRALPKGDEV